MERFIGSKIITHKLYIEGKEVNHLKAKRIKVGEIIEAWFEGKTYLCKVEHFSKDRVVCEVLSQAEQTLPQPLVYLYQCVPVDIKKMDAIVEKLSEVGAFALIPTVSQRSFQKFDVIRSKIDRWNRIALSSLKQCKRDLPLKIQDVIRLEEIQPDHNLNILLDNFHEGKLIKELDLKDAQSVGIVVGPEGGFSQEEGENLRLKGFISVRLKPYVLRVETAASLAVGLIMNLS